MPFLVLEMCAIHALWLCIYTAFVFLVVTKDLHYAAQTNFKY